MPGQWGLTQQDVVDYVVSNLGAPAITVHVTPGQIQREIDYTLNVLSRRKPRVKYATIGATAGLQHYRPDPDKVGYGVLTVFIPRMDPIAPLLLSAGPRLDIFGYRYSYPYRNIAELEIDYMYFEMATRVLSSEIDWEFIDDEIWIYPAPQDTFQFGYAYAVPKILGDPATETRSTVLTHDWDWIQEAVLARSKIIEGRILRRYSQIPGATAPLSTDGDSLVTEGTRDWERMLSDLETRTPELPFSKMGSPGELPLSFG